MSPCHNAPSLHVSPAFSPHLLGEGTEPTRGQGWGAALAVHVLSRVWAWCAEEQSWAREVCVIILRCLPLLQMCVCVLWRRGLLCGLNAPVYLTKLLSLCRSWHCPLRGWLEGLNASL